LTVATCPPLQHIPVVPDGSEKAAQWVVVSVRPLLLIALCLAGAGCGFGGGSSGVRVATAASEPDATSPSDRVFSDAAPDALGGDAAAGAGEKPGSGAQLEASTTELPATVAVVGDSLTLSAQDQIETAFAGLGIDVVAIDGVESRRMVSGGSSRPPGVDAIDAILAAGTRPDLWIIALGTNDVGAESGSDKFRDDVLTLLRRVPPGDPVIWMDLFIRNREDAVAAANDTLRTVLGVRPDSEVADWFARGDDPGTITGDGIHLTDAGRVRFAATMTDAVVAMFGR
jgi:lysophospholipase L1-like esterase